VNWARGPFFREQHAMPGLLYLLGYLVVVPLVVYFPTHLLLQWSARRGGFVLAEREAIVHGGQTKFGENGERSPFHQRPDS